MGMNYYTEQPDGCECCGRNEYGRLHIGKSSWGWKFNFAAHYEPSIESVKDWRKYLKGRRIWDEDNRETNSDAFWEMVEKKQVTEDKDHTSYCRDSEWESDRRHYREGETYYDDEGYTFSKGEFS